MRIHLLIRKKYGLERYKKGKFTVPEDYIRKQSNEVTMILAKMRFVSTRVEHLYYPPVFIMEGISEQFEEKKEGEMISCYEIIINVLDDGEKTGSVRKQKEGSIKLMF